MLSGTLTPSSATNLVPRPKNLEEDCEKRQSAVTSQITTTAITTITTTTTTTTINTVITAPSTSSATTTATAVATSATSLITNERTRTDSSGRSAALERAYVHDVYENCEETVGPILRPRVAQFLAGLEAGSLVCDVGCGNGRYLNSCNPLIYTIGIDRCYRLTKIARCKGGEVAICDNLELPFRDESFDAVLSLAVVHHFATTERRVGAIRELARILRIGGRVIISVWALEQRHKRFESQDVLVPWQPPKNKKSNTSDDEDDDDFLPPYHAYTEDSTNSSRSAGDGDSSSLSSSSPGESCYSFVRRAIQKLAGGKKHPWFLESWNSKDTKHDSSLDYEDAKDLPIELRRLEDFDDIPEPPLSAGLKSRSLGSILNPPPRTIVRSRSSVPSLGAQIPETKQPLVANESRRPKLVKQKQSFCDDVDFPLPEFSHVISNESRVLLRKQSSLNEELMAESRLREKDRVRKKIQKQMSLNEAFLCRSLFTKRLQVIREGFTTKLKSSTGNLERVTKNGFVKIIQNIKGNQNQSQNTNYSNSNNNNNNNNNINNNSNSSNSQDTNATNKITSPAISPNVIVPESGNGTCNGNDDEQKPRRHSRESGSDSSKDSSLQSDTSIESEDSFASVIYIPKPDTDYNSIKMPSVPTSPLVITTPIQSPAPSRCKLQANLKEQPRFTFEEAQLQKSDDTLKPEKITRAFVKAPKITRQQIKELPPIPKFKKTQSFPIVRRISAAPAMPKLLSLEIFNPETDDLDSDSSEPSSPDSIDSVISALKPTSTEIVPVTDDCVDGCCSSSSSSDHKNNDINIIKDSIISVKDEGNDDSGVCGGSVEHCEITCNITASNNDDSDDDDNNEIIDNDVCRQHLVDFAEKLSAQLLKELDENSDSDVIIKKNGHSLSLSNNKHNNREDVDPYIKKLNGEIRDLNTLREELRKRRLMLANLNSTHGCSNNNNNNFNTNINKISTNQSDVIHEEDESPVLNDGNILSQLEHDENKFYDLIRDDECDKIIGDEFNVDIKDIASDDSENDIDKDDDDFDEDDDYDNRGMGLLHKDTALLIQEENPSENVLLDKTMNNNLNISRDEHKTNTIYHSNNKNNINNNNNNLTNKLTNQQRKSVTPSSLESHQSLDSWEHSNSTGSLDSPHDGSATHHRYYHVFREGELDSLINHHVASLHIVSSYYERASWCVVAEKVQVWTI